MSDYFTDEDRVEGVENKRKSRAYFEVVSYLIKIVFPLNKMLYRNTVSKVISSLLKSLFEMWPFVWTATKFKAVQNLFKFLLRALSHKNLVTIFNLPDTTSL